MLGDAGFVAALCLARIAFGYQFQSLASLGPELVVEFNLAYATLGTLIGAYMVPGIVLALPGGFLGRRFGARIVLAAGLALMCCGSLVALLVFSPAGIGAGRAISGTGAIALVVMQGKMVADRFPGRAFMPVMSLLVGAFPVGAGLVGLTYGLVVAAAGPLGLFVVGAAIPAASLALFLATAERDIRPTTGFAFPPRRETVLVIVAGLVWTAYNAGYYGFLSYVPSVLAARQHSPATIAAVMTIATWANLPATVAGGWLASRFGNAPVLWFGTITGALAVAGPALYDAPMLWAALFGTAAAVHAGVIIAIGTLSARPENRAVGMGLFYTTYYLGGTTLPWVCGKVADVVGSPSGALVTAAGLSLLAIPIYMLHRQVQRS